MDRIVLHNGDLVLHRRKEYTNAVWQYKLRLPNGKDERKTTHRTELADAQQFAEHRYQDVRICHERGLSYGQITFDQAATEFTIDSKRKFKLSGRTKTSRHDYNMSIVEGPLMRYFGGKFIAKITEKEIDAYHVWYHSEWEKSCQSTVVRIRTKSNNGHVYPTPLRVVSPGKSVPEPNMYTIKRAQSLLEGIFRLAVRNRHIAASEIPLFTPITIAKRRRGAFTTTEQLTLLTHLEKRIPQTKTPKHRASRRLLLYYVQFNLLTGLRPGSESLLRFVDIEFRDGNRPHVLLKVRDGKTGPRDVIASNELREVVAAIKAQHPNPEPNSMIWATQHGETGSFCQQFLEVLKELGMTKDSDGNHRSLYSLRHSYITDRLTLLHTPSDKLALNCGTSPVMIQQNYAHLRVHDHIELLTQSVKTN